MSDNVVKMEDNKNIYQILDEKIPRSAVSKRKGGNGGTLDYLETWYVIDRLNKVFGNLGWSQETVFLNQVAVADKPTYIAKVRLTVQMDQGWYVTHEGIGYGNDKGGFNPHELAVKEAESDALKRAAMKFGLSMGLALYDKTQEHVSETNEVELETGAGDSKRVTAIKPKSSKGDTGPTPTDAPKHSGTESSGTTGKTPLIAATKTREDVNSLISSCCRAAIAKRLFKDAIEIRAYMASSFGVDTKEALTDAQATTFLNHLDKLINGETTK